MFAVIYIPDFSLQAALRPSPELRDGPVALIDPALPKMPVVQLTQAARNSGVREGMTSTQALTRCPGLAIKTRSAAHERTAGDVLLRCADCFSPAIEATAAGVVTLDLNGFPNLSAADYAQKMIEQLRLVHLFGHVGVAENPLLALYAARSARPVLVMTDSSGFLNALPVDAIGPSVETVAILEKWGIRNLGDFLALDREQVADRLGVEALALFERASANTTRPLRLVQPSERFEEAIEFENEIETAEPLLFVLRRFVEQISVQMEMTGWVAEELTLRLKFSGGQDYERVFKVPSPTRDQTVLFRTLHTHLENLKTERGIVGISLSGKHCAAVNRQFGLFETALRDPNRFGETLARLSALVGSERVGTPFVQSTHRPDAFQMKRPDFDNELDSGRRARLFTPEHGEGGSDANVERRARSDAPYLSAGMPLRRFRPPLMARIELDQMRPVYLKTNQFSQPIRETRGPWRSSGDWWDSQAWARDEWDVQTLDGSLYRVFEENGEWFVDGVYD